MAKWEVREDLSAKLLEHGAIAAVDIYGGLTLDQKPIYRSMVRLNRGIAATVQIEAEIRQILRALTSADASIHLEVIPSLPVYLPRPVSSPTAAPATVIKIP